MRDHKRDFSDHARHVVTANIFTSEIKFKRLAKANKKVFTFKEDTYYLNPYHDFDKAQKALNTKEELCVIETNQEEEELDFTFASPTSSASTAHIEDIPVNDESKFGTQNDSKEDLLL